jgi:hypothetical protein
VRQVYPVRAQIDGLLGAAALASAVDVEGSSLIQALEANPMTLSNLRRIIVFATALILGMFIGSIESRAQDLTKTGIQTELKG